MDWELSKENFQPLKRGRNPVNLDEDVKSPSASRCQLEDERRRLCREISQYSGDDPLEPWMRYIKWTQAAYKAGGHQAELVPLLERCTRELQDDARYKNDLRYLRLWIQYADCLPDPKDVFAFLLEKDIGQDLALFYIAYASFLELRGSYDRAEAMYQAGLDRMAAPVHKLRVKHDAFKERMARRRLRGVAVSSEEDPRTLRESLGALSQKGREVVRKPGKPTGQQAGLALRPQSRGDSLSGDKENTTAGGLEVYVDDSFKPGAVPPSADADFAKAKTAGAWMQLGGQEATRKENEQKAAKFKSSKFRQNKALMQQPDPCLDIPEDEELKAVEVVAAKPPQGTLRQRLEADSESGAHKKDPLRHVKEASEVPSGSNSCERQANHTGSHGDVQKPAEGKDQPSDEVSFEEVRAQRWLSSQRASGAESSDLDRRGGKGDNEPGACNDNEQPSGGPAAAKVSGTEAALHESPAASADRLPSQTRRQSEGQALEMTMNTLLAFDSVNDMFRGPLQQDFGWQLNEPTATVRVQEPTISTRAAMEAVGCMFNSRMAHGNLEQDFTGRISGRTHRARPSTAGSHAEDRTTGFAIHEDTELLRRPEKHGMERDCTENFLFYEDTEFRGGPSLGSPGGNNAGDTTSRPRGRSRRGTDSFGVYQDTEFLGSNASRQRSDDTTGFQVYEDTNFI